MSRRVIVGAGPAGLAGAFWRLRDDPDCELHVVESGRRPGGWVRSELLEGYLCEIGPQAVRPSVELDDLVDSLDARDLLVPAAETAKARWIGRGGRLLKVPMGPGQLLRTPLLTLGGKLRLLKEPFVKRADNAGESVTSFVGRRFGPQTAPLVQAMVSGIFAGDADRLEMASAFPTMADAERGYGSVLKGMKKGRKKRRAAPKEKRASLYTFRGGMEGLIRRMADALGERLKTDCGVQGVERHDGGFLLRLEDGTTLTADELVLACPARVSAELLRELDSDLSRELHGIPYASLASVYLGFPARDLPETLSGFGFLLEPGEKTPVLGAIYCQSLFPEHAPDGHGLLRVMIGGARWPEALDLTDDALTEMAIDAVRRYAGLDRPVAFRHVVRVHEAIPQYETGHAERMARIEQRLGRHPGLYLRGNSYRAVALAGQLGRASGTDVARVGVPARQAQASIAP